MITLKNLYAFEFYIAVMVEKVLLTHERVGETIMYGK